jgi:hypothetical protein
VLSVALHVTEVEATQHHYQLQMTTSLSAESKVLASMADEVKAQNETIKQYRVDNVKMLKQLVLLKKQIKKLERQQNGLN